MNHRDEHPLQDRRFSLNSLQEAARLRLINPNSPADPVPTIPLDANPNPHQNDLSLNELENASIINSKIRNLAFPNRVDGVHSLNQNAVGKESTPSSWSLLWNVVGNLCWLVFNNIFLLQMGGSYFTRLEYFLTLSNGGIDLLSIKDWRRDQNNEWNRLSTTLALLATMQGTILGIVPRPPQLATCLWLGGASLSVSGVFIVQYFSIKALTISDADMGQLIKLENNEFIHVWLLASAMAAPVALLLWAAILFVAGMVDYIAQTDLGGVKFKFFVGVPLAAAVICMLTVMVLGESVDRNIQKKVGHFQTVDID